MKKAGTVEVAGYTTLPLQLPPTSTYPTPATHYLYIRPHEPRIPDPDSTRSLFIVNVPIDTTEVHLRHLFSTQLSAGRIERITFEDVPVKKPGLATATEPNLSHRPNKKRKRITADDLQSALDEIQPPSTWDRALQKSGAHAIVVFADKPSMESSLKAAAKAARKGHTLIWGEGIPADRIPPLGVQRYISHERRRYPERAALLRTVSDFMTVFEQVSEARKKEEAKKAGVPDEDGFVTVVNGPKLNSVAREEEMRELVERQKKKEEGLEDFYRFQSREKRKERQQLLLRRFDEDRRKLQDIKMRRGKIRVSLSLSCLGCVYDCWELLLTFIFFLHSLNEEMYSIKAWRFGSSSWAWTGDIKNFYFYPLLSSWYSASKLYNLVHFISFLISLFLFYSICIIIIMLLLR